MSPKQILLALVTSLLLMVVAMSTAGVEPIRAEPTLPPNYPFNTICSVLGYGDSGTDHYESLINHLEDLKGNALLGHQSGWSWCIRYSYQNNIGVYACNDNDFHDVQIPWSLLVDYAAYIHGRCTIQRKTKGVWTELVLGQAFIRMAEM